MLVIASVSGGVGLFVLALFLTPFFSNAQLGSTIQRTFNLTGGQTGKVVCAGGERFEVEKVSETWYVMKCIAKPTASPTVAPTIQPTAPANTQTPTTHVGHTSPPAAPNTQVGSESMAMNAWGPNGKNKPNPKYDKCDDGTDIVAAHKAFFVLGPDGKKYPTWHAPEVVNPITGNGKCYFGHEHGRDPKGSELWNTKQIQNYFYFDANKNNQMDADEEKAAGLPFGYVNEQMDAYSQSIGVATMRHEDHVGHKVEYANGEGDMATHQMDKNTTGGVWVGQNGNGVIAKDTGVRCFYLAKPHQGVSSGDAFTNNLHEVFYFADCRHSNSANNQKLSIAIMEGFGKAGGFTNFMPLCGIERRNNPQDFITLGKDTMNANYPDGDGDREIITRDCIEKGFLVPNGKFSGNMYEAWPASLSVVTSAGKDLVKGINLLFDVEDANRYYYPEAAKGLRGYKTVAPTNVGYTMDLCYETLGATKARGGACDFATNFGAIKDITWDDPRSGFKGTHRGMYFMPGWLDNEGTREVWYSDPFGKNAKDAPFAGSIKQQISAKKLNYSTLIGNAPIDPRVTDRKHTGGENNTVHAPN